MIEQAKILGLIEDLLAENKFFLVSLEVSLSNKIRLLVDSMKGVRIEDCVTISRAIEHGFDRDAEDFEIEVSSPGLDAPFKVKEQYLKNIGRPVEVHLKDGHKYEGLLLGADKNSFCVEVNKQVRLEGKKTKQTINEKVDFVYNEVSKVRVVISF